MGFIHPEEKGKERCHILSCLTAGYAGGLDDGSGEP